MEPNLFASITLLVISLVTCPTIGEGSLDGGNLVNEYKAILPQSTSSTANCSTGQELAKALTDGAISLVRIVGNVVLDDSNWNDGPVVLRRNLTIEGYAVESYNWPTLDMNYVKDKLKLGPSVVMKFRYLIMDHWRSGPHFQAPGLDLILTSDGGDATVDRPLPVGCVFCSKPRVGICVPYVFQGQSVSAIPRPKQYPGIQAARPNISQSAACARANNTATAAGPMGRCWPMVGIYDDIASSAKNINSFGILVDAGYILVIRQSFYICEAVMEDACVDALGLVGCFKCMFASNGTTTNSGMTESNGNAYVYANTSSTSACMRKAPSPPKLQLPMPPPLMLATAAAEHHRGPHLEKIMGGALGGGVLVGAAAGILLLAARWRRRRRRQADQPPQQQPKSLAESGCRVGEGHVSFCNGNRNKPGASVACSDDGGMGGGVWGVTAVAVAPGTPMNGGTAGQQQQQQRPVAVAGTAIVMSDPDPCSALRWLRQQHQQIGFSDASYQAPVTPLTRPQPGVNLSLELDSTQVVLTGVTLGKGAFGRVVRGMYGDVQVAVKLIDHGLHPAPYGIKVAVGAAGDAAAAGQRAAATADHVAAAAHAPVVVCQHRPLPAALAAAKSAESKPLQDSPEDLRNAESHASGMFSHSRRSSLITSPSEGDRGGGGGGLGGEHKPIPEALRYDSSDDNGSAGLRRMGPARTADVAPMATGDETSATTIATGAGAGPRHQVDVPPMQPAMLHDEEACGGGSFTVGNGGAGDPNAVGTAGKGEEHGGGGGRGEAGSTGGVEAGGSAGEADVEKICDDEPGERQAGGGSDGGFAAANQRCIDDGDGNNDDATAAAAVTAIDGAVDSGGGGAPSGPTAAENDFTICYSEYTPLSLGASESTATALAAAAYAAGADQESNSQAPEPNSLESTLKQEVEVLARCQHPNIVRLLAACLKPPQYCLVMELMDTSLDRLLYGSGGGARLMPLCTVLYIASQIAHGLAYLHPTIVHRDLKPGNVLISQYSWGSNRPPIVKLADFGLSRLRDTVLITRQPEVGTAPYIAPEAFDVRNHRITDRVDIYALGVILWEMLAGRRPWAGVNMVMIALQVSMHRKRLPLAQLPQERCPPKLQELIENCWEHSPARRPAAAEVVKRLALVLEVMSFDTTTAVNGLLSTEDA